MASAVRQEFTVKVVLLGDSGVGKTSLVLRYVKNTFQPFQEPTIGAAFMGKSQAVDDENRDAAVVHLKIWDTAGQERYQSLTPLYFRGAGAALLVYDICRLHSYQTLQRWVREVRNHNPNLLLMLVGNKSDLAEHRSIPQTDAELYAQELGAFYIETSAKDDCNVQELFLELARRAADTLPPDPTGRMDDRRSNATDRVDLLGTSSSTSRGCCYSRG